ncbi:CobW family GTP-binding protein [Campylobacter cuniculorum]|uniref:GTPase, G3E family n=2 Tax=Campylobacter cuniculorum TaxID=374106 RepID=A0A1W6BYA5_9BACT|nr:GTP-binding protein [Campylobacter cuniculorum]ARJ57032.1 GTPase, G3E family [Campylobacter cuniculorum DSM 23162 = LMG 24588]QOR04481.1 GTP-binding protein [Campylobacter cuniculorum]
MAKIPIHIITGFLGSGKTTFLAQLLQKQNHKNIALIVNELGQISLDDSIINASYIQEKTLILNAGCMCCNKRSDLVDKLRELLNVYEKKNEILERIIIETTGLANPAPIVFTLLSDTFLCNHFNLVNIITCIDALNGISHIDENEEAYNQILSSDCILITKTDLNPHIAPLKEKINSIHQGIDIFEKENFNFSMLSGIKHQSENFQNSKLEQNLHNQNIQSLSLSFDEALDWSVFSIWLSMLLHQYGSQILRVKGLLDIGEDFLVNINGVGHLIYPPSHIKKTKQQNSSHLVFIAKNLDLQKVLASLQGFLNPNSNVILA